VWNRDPMCAGPRVLRVLRVLPANFAACTAQVRVASYRHAVNAGSEASHREMRVSARMFAFPSPMPGTKLALLVARTELWLWFVLSRVSRRCARVAARGLTLQTSLTPKAVCFFDVSSDHHPNPNRCVFMHGKCDHGPGHATGRPEGNTIVCVVA